MSQETPLLSPEEIAVRAGQQAPFLLLPRRAEVFAERDIRLRQRAAGHAMRDYLLLMADLARAQHEVLQLACGFVLPDAEQVGEAARAGVPPLPATAWPRDPRWRDGLVQVLDRVLRRVPAGPARTSIAALRELGPQLVERQADRLLQTVTLGLDLAAAPFIAAGLQVYWTQMALALQERNGEAGPSPFGRTDDATRCPCCGSLPVASVARIDPGVGGLRYLHCSLCSAQWHMVRVKCSHCQGTKGIRYQSLEALDAATPAPPRKAAVEAETCDQCGSYLKIVRRDRDHEVEPVADDLASLTLDLLVAEAGFQRHCANLMLLFGDPDGPRDGGGG